MPDRMFQFPSNGKAYLKSVLNSFVKWCAPVSIPFKRESISKGERCVFLKEVNEKPVSIPFKRETISKVDERKSDYIGDISFNSLQTGKHI